MYTNIFKINYNAKLIHIFTSFKTTTILAIIITKSGEYKFL